MVLGGVVDGGGGGGGGGKTQMREVRGGENRKKKVQTEEKGKLFFTLLNFFNTANLKQAAISQKPEIVSSALLFAGKHGDSDIDLIGTFIHSKSRVC